MSAFDGLIAVHQPELALTCVVAFQHLGAGMVDLQTMQNSYYEKQGKLCSVCGDQPIEDAFRDIMKAIGAKA